MKHPLQADPPAPHPIETPLRTAALIVATMAGAAIATLIGLAFTDGIARAFDRPEACATLSTADCRVAMAGDR